jgi:pimeloyl-ACP methyl ester carboxylesterase
MAIVRRSFADFPEGQIHYRHSGAANDGVPLLMLHASPGSSLMLNPIIAALGDHRHVIAPDTLGNGDSMPPSQEQPEISDYAVAVLALIEELGVKQADFYGTHTGARIATYLALNHPERVRKIILDGFGLYTPVDLDEILRVYAPEVQPDQIGSQVMWAWHFCRDQFIYFPWFRKQKEFRVDLDLPDAEYLHDKFIEIMKSITTYHKSYRAAFRYSMATHVPLITQPTMITFAETDMVRSVYEEAVKLLPKAHHELLPGIRAAESVAVSMAALNRFLDE